MKYILSLVCVVLIALVFALCGLRPSGEQAMSSAEFLRIHIRANSNSEQDQAVKYEVKEAVVDALIPFLSGCESKQDAIDLLSENFAYIQSVADGVLAENGFDYSSKAQIVNEYFPTRVYGDLTLQEGNYDALILNLGSGSGNNWWCVVYPAFCFTQSKKSDNLVYISRIWDIIKNVMKW